MGLSTYILPAKSDLASAAVTGDSNAAGVLLTLAANRTDTGWNIAANVATYTGSPDRVVINAMSFVNEPENALNSRLSPSIELLRNGVIVAISATGYQRHATGHTTSSNTISFVDPNPGTNPQYSLRSQRRSNILAPAPIDLGSVSFEAVR